MKKVFTFLSSLLLMVSVFAQSPEKMSYQAVIRNSSDVLVTNTNISMQISILQSTASGAEVYVETQMPTVNANGLVSIEIGNGTVVDGDFTTIDWTAGPYFIKTETDPSGGTSYSITGTSQLLSVPYALHAKTAETITGEITETDPEFTAWDKDYDDLVNSPTVISDFTMNANTQSITNLANPENAQDATTKDYVDNLVIQVGVTSKLLALGYTAQELMDGGHTIYDLTAAGVDLSELLTLGYTESELIGKPYQGGVIAYISQADDPGYVAGEIHGLIAASADQSTGIQWYKVTEVYNGSYGDSLYAGISNTAILIAAFEINDPTGFYAVTICDNYSVTVNGIVYDDWYLPSNFELELLYAQKDAIGGFSKDEYWSSTELARVQPPMGAFRLIFRIGVLTFDNNTDLCSVRAVRAF